MPFHHANFLWGQQDILQYNKSGRNKSKKAQILQ